MSDKDELAIYIRQAAGEWDDKEVPVVMVVEEMRDATRSQAQEIEHLREQRDHLRSRNEGMEAALGELRCDLINAKLSIRDMRVLGETTKTRTELDVDEQRIDMKIRKIDRALASPDSEPAEGPRDAGVGPPEERVAALNKPAEGADHSSRDFEGTDPRGMGPLPGEPGNPNPSFEQMERQDAMLERRDALLTFESLVQDGIAIGLGQLDYTNPEVAADVNRKVEIVRQALCRTSDEGGVVESVYRSAVQGRSDFRAALRQERQRRKQAEGVLRSLRDEIRKMDHPEELAELRDQADKHFVEWTSGLNRALADPAVPEAVRRLPEKWRKEANTLRTHKQYDDDPGIEDHALSHETCADELDRALAEQGEQRVPEACVVAEDHPVGNDAVYVADTCIARGDWFAMTTLRDQINRAFRAAAPQPEHSQPDSGEES